MVSGFVFSLPAAGFGAASGAHERRHPVGSWVAASCRDLRLASEPQALILRRTEPFAGLRRTRIQKPKTRKTNGENQQKNQRRQTNGDKPEATSTAGVLRTHLTANN